MTNVRPASSFPSFTWANPGWRWSTYLQLFHGCYGLLVHYFVISSLSHACLSMTPCFSLCLSNRPTLRDMCQLCRVEKIAPFCSQRRGCTNYSSMQIKQLNTVILPYFCAVPLRGPRTYRHKVLHPQSLFPWLYGSWIIHLHVAPWKSYNQGSTVHTSLESWNLSLDSRTIEYESTVTTNPWDSLSLES